MPKSKIFALVLVSFISGIFLRSVEKIPTALAAGIFVFAIFVILRTRRAPQGAVPRRFTNAPQIVFGVCILSFAFGIWKSSTTFDYSGLPASQNIAGKIISFEGKIAEEPDRRIDYAQYVVENETIGKVLVKTDLYPEYFYGDIVKIRGKVETPENGAGSGFDYKNYLAKDGIFLASRYPKIDLTARPTASFYGRLLEFKKSFVGKINDLLAEPQASFLAALLVGARRSLPADLTDAFNKTGTSHIIAISGYNISIISIVLMNFLGFLFFPRRLIFWLVGISLVLFTLVAGAGASVVRAAIMGGLLILAKREGRMYRMTNAIIFAGAVMLFLNPYLLRYDAGFQLSFLSALGLIYISPYLEKKFSRLTDFLSLRSNLAATLSAQIATLPIIIFSFGRFSVVSVLANVLILPAVPFTMLFGFLAGLAAFVSLKIASVFIFPTWFALSYQIWIVKILSALPFASIPI